ncbi:MAG: radical SAM protein [Acidobacteria bacterium]|nr:radical SAM protein [Acidobacteriota bacterium]MCA1611642.1 radical SAM protein [Acidobacteriota bacterium]
MSYKRGLQLAKFARRHLGRMGQGRREVMRHLTAPTAANLPMPTFVQLRVTNLCNLRCKMCGQWGDTGIYRSDGFPASATDGQSEGARIRELIGLNRQMDLPDYVRLLDEIAPWQPIVSLFGGEPLLYPDILPLVREIKKRGLTCTIITNGGRLEQYARDLVEAGIDSIAVSIDGPEEVHNRIRGKADAYQKAVDGVRAIARWRKELGRPMPMQIAILPVTELNIGDIAAAVAALRELPIDTINVGLRWFVPKETGSEYESVMRETFGVAGDSWKGFEFDAKAAMDGTKTRQMTDLVKLLKGLKRRRFLDSAQGKPWTSFVPDVAPSKVPEYFSDFQQTFGHNLCPVAWYFAQVEPDGDVTFCGDFPDYVIGNVRRETFREVWTGEKATRFRDKLAKEPLPICNRCCGNFVYGKWDRPEGTGAGNREPSDQRTETAAVLRGQLDRGSGIKMRIGGPNP